MSSTTLPGPTATFLQGAVFPDGTRTHVSPGRDPREIFADWLIDGRNPWFARNIVNRIWSWLFGRGIVHEPDDIRADNPPRHPELLAWLEKELAAAHFDLKHIYRIILNSKAYQLSSIPKSDRPDAEESFACYPLRRLEAEVLIDALNQITGTTEKYSSAVPEPFTFVPENQRSIVLADGSTTSAFLELFGRPSRDTGLEQERNNHPTSAQRLHLLNSSHIQRKLVQSRKLQTLLQSILFRAGNLPEFSEKHASSAPGPNLNPLGRYMNRSRASSADTELTVTLPAVVNGQITPGDVDRIRFQARRGQPLVVVASARELIPYLPDAVPGWFQAVLALYDSGGNELAFADDFRFHPDPVLYHEVLTDGEYVVEIRDAIYRGREDFVYRITLGELPFVTESLAT